MIVANNFGTEAYWRELAAPGGPGGENTRDAAGTWGGLGRLLAGAGVGLGQCYFTNAFTALLPGDRPLVGDLPGSADVSFRAACRASLLGQIGVVRPRVILALGSHAIGLLGELSGALSAWCEGRSARSFAAIDTAGLAVVHGVVVPEHGLTLAAVALTHPSWSNQHLRSHSTPAGMLRGPQAEHAMIREALERA